MNVAKNDQIEWISLLESLRKCLSTEEINKSEVIELLSAYRSKEEDWLPYVFFDEECYTKNLVDTGNGKYNLIVAAWNPAQGTSIHDHAKSRCFVKILAGATQEMR